MSRFLRKALGGLGKRKPNQVEQAQAAVKAASAKAAAAGGTTAASAEETMRRFGEEAAGATPEPAAIAQDATAEVIEEITAPPSEPETYVVQPGDSLSAIAQQLYGDGGQYMRIFEANRDQLQDPNLIHPGQVLIIPR